MSALGLLADLTIAESPSEIDSRTKRAESVALHAGTEIDSKVKAFRMSNPSIPDVTDWLEREESQLATYAMRASQSRGRAHHEEPHLYRTPYQRDRDRIVHSTAFRRLMYKTQVLAAATNDHHRTRLTHTLEVAMISRTIARRLGLNEDLTEAIALSHDLGHPPFGHAGERALNEQMQHHGGFEHNLHGLRIIDILEYPYPDFPGLNLTWEVREAMAHHSKKRDSSKIQELLVSGHPVLEAQIVDAADSLAYDTHDIDDALSGELISFADLEEVELWRRVKTDVEKQHGKLAPEQLQPTMIRTLINRQVADLFQCTLERVKKHRIERVEDARECPVLLAAPSEEVRELKTNLEEFLFTRVDLHHRVQRMAAKGSRLVKHLFTEMTQSPQLLPERYQRRIEENGLHRTVCDYLAGMTDRFAQDEYQRLFQPFINV